MAAAARPVQARPKTPTLREQWDAFAQMAVRLLAVLFNWAITFALLGLLGLAGWGFWQKLQVPVTHIGVGQPCVLQQLRLYVGKIDPPDVFALDSA